MSSTGWISGISSDNIQHQINTLKKLIKQIDDAEKSLEVIVDNNVNAIAEIEEDINVLTANVETNAEDISDLQTDVSELQTDVSELQTDVSALQTDVSELQTDVSELQTDVSELQTNVETNAEDIETNTSDIDNLYTMISLQEFVYDVFDFENPNRNFTTLYSNNSDIIKMIYDEPDDMYKIFFRKQDGNYISLNAIINNINEIAEQLDGSGDDILGNLVDTAQEGFDILDGLGSFASAGAGFVGGLIASSLSTSKGDGLFLLNWINVLRIAVGNLINVLENELIHRLHKDRVIKIYSRNLTQGDPLDLTAGEAFSYVDNFKPDDAGDLTEFESRGVVFQGEEILTLGNLLTEAELITHVFGNTPEDILDEEGNVIETNYTLRDYKIIFKGKCLFMDNVVFMDDVTLPNYYDKDYINTSLWDNLETNPKNFTISDDDNSAYLTLSSGLAYDDYPLLWYRFDNENDVLKNYGRAGRDYDLTGPYTHNTTGSIYKSGYVSLGANERLVVDIEGLNLNASTRGVTICLWIKVPDFTGSRAIHSFSDGNNNGMGVRIQGGGIQFNHVYNNGLGLFGNNQGGQYIDEWFFIAQTGFNDISQRRQTWNDNHIINPGSILPVLNFMKELRIGYHPWGNEYLNGDIAEVRLYDRHVSFDELDVIYYRGIAIQGSENPSPNPYVEDHQLTLQPNIIFKNLGDDNNIGLYVTDNNDFVISNSSRYGNDIVFKTGSTVGYQNGTERMRIHSNGNVTFAGSSSFLNDLSVTNNLYIGNSTNYLSHPTGDFGSIQINGNGKGNWRGYNIDGRVVFMHDGNNTWGIYDDVNNRWKYRNIIGAASDEANNNTWIESKSLVIQNSMNTPSHERPNRKTNLAFHLHTASTWAAGTGAQTITKGDTYASISILGGDKANEYQGFANTGMSGYGALVKEREVIKILPHGFNQFFKNIAVDVDFVANINVSGTSTLTGNVTCTNNLTVENNLTVNGVASINSLNVTNTLTVLGNLEVQGQLVTVDTTSSLNLEEKLFINSKEALRATNLETASDTYLKLNNAQQFTNGVEVTGNLTCLADISATGAISGTAINGSSVTSSGAISGTSISCSSITSSGAISGTSISCSSVTSSGAISGTAISGSSVSSSGAISGTSISGSSLSLSGSITCTGGTLNGNVTIGNVISASVCKRSFITLTLNSGNTWEYLLSFRSYVNKAASSGEDVWVFRVTSFQSAGDFGDGTVNSASVIFWISTFAGYKARIQTIHNSGTGSWGLYNQDYVKFTIPIGSVIAENISSRTYLAYIESIT